MTEEKIELKIQGMTCDSCALHVGKALEGVTGVMNVEVPGWKSGRAVVIASPGVDSAALSQSWAPPIPGLEETGYLTSTTAMDLKNLPKSMIVLGANAVGCCQGLHRTPMTR